MASVLKRDNKNGVSYRIQVFVRNAGTGKNEVKTVTWRPPQDVTEREAKRLLDKFTVEFEERCRKDACIENGIDVDLTLSEYSEIWLESLKQNRSASYYASCRYHANEICKKLGGYKLRQLSPIIIQRFMDNVKNHKYTVGYAVASGFADIMKERKITLISICRTTKISDSTLTNAMRGDRIDIEKAKQICAAIDEPLEKCFEISKVEKHYMPATIGKILRTLRTILSTAKRQQLVEHNYASGDYIRPVKMHRNKIVCLDEEQARTLAGALMDEPDIRVKTSLLLILLTGIRRGEAAGLEWDDIDLDKGEISVKRSCVSVAGIGVVTGNTKTNTSMREITMPDSLTALVKDYRLWWEDRVKMLGDRYKGCQRVFLSDDGARLHPCTFRYWLKKITQRLGLPDVHIHSLRHTNITLQILAGIPLKTVSVRAGHSTTKLTVDTYWQYFKEEDKEAARTLDSIFKR
ncbi:MAG: site-specific integrase [Firmicutes bacterium]|nr:site-specific integrase [Bacillota bacterium]